MTSSQGWQTVAVVRKNSDKTEELKSLPNISIIELNMDEYHLLGEKAGFADCLVCLAWDGTRGASRRNESLQKTIMSLINKMKSNETCEMTECIQKWDYLYVDDAVKAIFNLCTVDCPDGAYNLASGDVRQLKDYVEEMYEVLDSNSELKYGAIPYPDSGMVSIQPSIEKICKETLWNAETKFRDGLKAIIGTDESTVGI